VTEDPARVSFVWNDHSSARPMADVARFHMRFGLSAPAVPQLLRPDAFAFRVQFMQEELTEYVEACRRGDMADAADALVDLVYVVLGTMYLHGFPFDALWDEVQACNMRKVRAADASQSKRGSSLDVVKPPGWEPPRIAQILARHGAAISFGVT